MKKILISCLLIISSCGGKKHAMGVAKTGQDDNKAFVTAESLDAVPPYGLEKIKKLVTIKKGDLFNHASMNEIAYALLSLRERFTYHMINPEQYAQT